MNSTNFYLFLDKCIKHNVKYVQFINWNFDFIIPSVYLSMYINNFNIGLSSVFRKNETIQISFDMSNWFIFNGTYELNECQIDKIFKLKCFI